MLHNAQYVTAEVLKKAFQNKYLYSIVQNWLQFDFGSMKNAYIGTNSWLFHIPWTKSFVLLKRWIVDWA